MLNFLFNTFQSQALQMLIGEWKTAQCRLDIWSSDWREWAQNKVEFYFYSLRLMSTQMEK